MFVTLYEYGNMPNFMFCWSYILV